MIVRLPDLAADGRAPIDWIVAIIVGDLGYELGERVMGSACGSNDDLAKFCAHFNLVAGAEIGLGRDFRWNDHHELVCVALYNGLHRVRPFSKETEPPGGDLRFAAVPGLPLAVLLLLLLMHRRLANYFLLHVAGHHVIVGEFHRKTPLPAGHAR